jgi:uncharacterized OsmC-like protein
MKLLLLSENSLRLDPAEPAPGATAGPGGVSIESTPPSERYSPFHMVAGGLAYCTWSALVMWARNANLDAAALAIDVSWEFADHPHRVGELNVHLDWPTLPLTRRDAAKRAAEQCTVHATLQHPPRIHIDL